MSPLLQDGEEIIVALSPYVHNSLQTNDIVVLYHPLRPNLIMVKRIKTIEQEEKGEKKYFVQGDNLEASTDSRHFGLIDENLIIGKVICRFP
jgi:nickel-type superoxide dismutase maturation protease